MFLRSGQHKTPSPQKHRHVVCLYKLYRGVNKKILAGKEVKHNFTLKVYVDETNSKSTTTTKQYLHFLNQRDKHYQELVWVFHIFCPSPCSESGCILFAFALTTALSITLNVEQVVFSPPHCNSRIPPSHCCGLGSIPRQGTNPDTERLHSQCRSQALVKWRIVLRRASSVKHV